MENRELNLRVLVFKGRKNWVAQCLDFDFGAQARYSSYLPERFERSLRNRIDKSPTGNENPLSWLPEPPGRYLLAWGTSVPVKQDSMLPPCDVDGLIVSFQVRIALTEPGRLVEK